MAYNAKYRDARETVARIAFQVNGLTSKTHPTEKRKD